MAARQESKSEADDEVVLEVPESALDTMLSPLVESGSQTGLAGQHSIMQWMVSPTGRNAPFICYKRSNGENQVILRITPQ